MGIEKVNYIMWGSRRSKLHVPGVLHVVCVYATIFVSGATISCFLDENTAFNAKTSITPRISKPIKWRGSTKSLKRIPLTD